MSLLGGIFGGAGSFLGNLGHELSNFGHSTVGKIAIGAAVLAGGAIAAGALASSSTVLGGAAAAGSGAAAGSTAAAELAASGGVFAGAIPAATTFTGAAEGAAVGAVPFFGGGSAGVGTLGAATAQAVGTAGATSNLINAGVIGSSSGVLSTLTNTVQSVSTAIHSVTDVIAEFQNNIIAPILGPIQQGYNTVNALIQTLHRDLNSGITGLLRIPTDIAGAFTSLDATLTRSLQMLGASNADNISGLLVPGIAAGVGAPLSALHDVFSAVLPRAKSEWTPPPRVSLSQGVDIEKFKEYVRQQQDELQNDTSLPAQFFHWLFKAVGVLEGIAAEREPFVALWREEIARGAGIRKFDPGTVQLLHQRGELTTEAATEELRVQGFSTGRAAGLLALERVLLPSGTVRELLARDWITYDIALQMLADQGWDRDDAFLYLNSGFTQLDGGTLQEMVRRGIVPSEYAVLELVRQGFAKLDAEYFVSTASRLLGLQDWIAAYDRASVQSAGLGFASLTQDAPPGFREAAARLGVAEGDSNVLWANHWRLLDPALAVQAWFRGYINRPMLDQVLAAASLPPDVWQNYIDLQRPLVPYRSITTLMSQGIISEADAENILAARGFDPVSINWLVQIEKKSAAPSKAASAEHVHGLTQATILGLFDTGTIEHAEASKLLADLGWSDEAVESVLLLHEVQQAVKDRAAKVDLTIDRAKAGLIGYNDAVAQLQALQLTTRELNLALGRLTTEISQHTKLPSEAKILSLWQHGLLDQVATHQALTLLGYSEGWATLLIELEALHGSGQSQQASAG